MDWLSWVLSATNICILWLMGNKSPWGPRIGVLNQVLWFFYIATTEQWGLLPGVIIYTIIHIRNVIRWNRE